MFRTREIFQHYTLRDSHILLVYEQRLVFLLHVYPQAFPGTKYRDRVPPAAALVLVVLPKWGNVELFAL